MAFRDKQAQIAYNNEFNKSQYDRINLMVKKGKKEVIKAQAAAAGESVNAFINRAIDLLLEQK